MCIGRLPGCDAVRVAWLDDESLAAVVQDDAAFRGGQPGAEQVEQGVDEADRVAVLIDHRQIDRVVVPGQT